MSVCIVTIGADGGALNDGDFSTWIKHIDTWREDWKVGRFAIEIDNYRSQALGDINPNEAVEIQIGSLLMADAALGQKNIYVSNPLSWAVGQPITLDDDTPDTEIDTIASITPASFLITLTNNLTNNYTVAENAILLPDPRAIMKGYVDNSLLRGIPREFAHPEILTVTGRDHARDLARLYHTTELYTDGLTRIDDQMDAILNATGSEITYASGGAYVAKPSTWKRTYMLRGFRELAEQDNALFIVLDTKAFALIDLDNPTASGVTLKSVAEAIDNNVLWIDPQGEKVGESIVNYIEVLSGNIDDHWTEGTAAAFANANDIAAITNEVNAALVTTNNASLRGEIAAGGAHWSYFMLTTSTYDHATLNFTKIGKAMCHVNMRHNAGISKRLAIFLEDDDSNIIYWNADVGTTVGGGAGLVGAFFTKNKWFKIPFPIGVDYDEASGLLKVADFDIGIWVYHTQNSNFTWNITKIGFGAHNMGAGEFIYADGLFLDGVEALSIADDGESPPEKSMLPVHRPDLSSQVELDLLSAQLLLQMKLPMETLKPIVIGQTSNVYTGRTVAVNTPGISTVTHRIQALHHAWGDRELDRWGSKHITDYFLLKQVI